MLKRLEESLIRREENLREKSMKAGSENKKVEEIVFINAVKQELTKADIQERLKESEARRDEITRQRQQRQKEHQAKLKTAADKRKKRSEEEAMRVRASLEKRSEAAELKRLETLKERQISAARVKEKEIRIKKNKEALAMKKREKMERKKNGGGGGSSGRWRKVGRGGGTQRSGAAAMISVNGSDIGQCTTDEEGDNSGMETIGQSMTPVRAGVDVMPCLVASTKSMTSPMTPPSSPPGRQSRGGGAGRSMFHVITGDETGESDVDDLLAGGGGELRSPRKRFRTALLNGETIDVASNAYDEAAERGRGRGMDPIVVGAAVGSTAVVVMEEEEENNNGVTNASSSPNKKRNKKKKKGKSKSKSKSKNKRSNGGGKNNSSSTGSSSVSSPKRTSGESSARGGASTTIFCTSTSSSSSATNEMSIAKQKVMRKRMKKLKDRLKKFSFRKTTLRCGDKAAECQEDGDDEGNGASANEGLYPDHEEKYNLTWEEGASASLKKGRSLLYVVLY